MDNSTVSFTKEEQATLKAALAFVVLRNDRKKRKMLELNAGIVDNSKTEKTSIPFCRNILLPTDSPPFSSLCNIHHVEQMLQVVLASIHPTLYHGKKSDVFLIPTCGKKAELNTNDRLESIASNMGYHLIAMDPYELRTWVEKSTLEHDLTSICTIWLCIAQKSMDTNLVLNLMNAIGGLITKIYHDEIIINTNSNSDAMMVNLLFLIEAFVALRHQSNSSHKVLQELLSVIDQKLTLPISVKEIPSFVQQQNKAKNLSAPSKILTHLALYDLTLKLTAIREKSSL